MQLGEATFNEKTGNNNNNNNNNDNNNNNNNNNNFIYLSMYSADAN